VIDASLSRRAESTVNRHLAAVFGLYHFHARHGVKVAEELIGWRSGGRGSYKPFLDQVGGRARRRTATCSPEGEQAPAKTSPSRRSPCSLTPVIT